MDVLRAILDAQNDGPFVVLTPAGVKAFSDFEECEKYTESLTGDFAVVRLLWGDRKPMSEAQPRDTREEQEARRQEVDRMARAAMLQNLQNRPKEEWKPMQDPPKRLPSPALDKWKQQELEREQQKRRDETEILKRPLDSFLEK